MSVIECFVVFVMVHLNVPWTKVSAESVLVLSRFHDKAYSFIRFHDSALRNGNIGRILSHIESSSDKLSLTKRIGEIGIIVR